MFVAHAQHQCSVGRRSAALAAMRRHTPPSRHRQGRDGRHSHPRGLGLRCVSIQAARCPITRA
eukprot:3574384-Pyramimonas_sp.AAC.1